MNLVMKVTQLLVAVFLICFVQSCTSAPDKIVDNQLSSFMVGGIYFVNGYGGTAEVIKIMASSGYTTDADLVKGYKQMLEFPYDQSQKEDIEATLKDWWGVTDKASLLSTLEKLKNSSSKYKAWDYARYANNSCFGYGAGYLTKAEVLKGLSEVLTLVKANYTSWEQFFSDFYLGRVEWSPEDDQNQYFKQLAKSMTVGEKSIYSILPLN